MAGKRHRKPVKAKQRNDEEGDKWTAEKEARLLQVLNAPSVDLGELKKLAVTPGGLLSSAYRQKAWPVLIGLSQDTGSVVLDGAPHSHSQSQQVSLDVPRSLGTYPSDISANEKEELRSQLRRLIDYVLCRQPNLHYYQGYNSLAGLLLVVLGEKSAKVYLEQLSLRCLKDYMAPTIDPAREALHLLPLLLELTDYELYSFLDSVGIAQEPIFALDCVITWYAHVAHKLSTASRLMDFFLAYAHPLMPVYVAVVYLILKRKELLDAPADYGDVFMLCKAFDESVSADLAIANAASLWRVVPPSKLLPLVKMDPIKSRFVDSHPYWWKDGSVDLDSLKGQLFVWSGMTIDSQAVEKSLARLQKRNAEAAIPPSTTSVIFTRRTLFVALAVAGVAVLCRLALNHFSGTTW